MEPPTVSLQVPQTPRAAEETLNKRDIVSTPNQRYERVESDDKVIVPKKSKKNTEKSDDKDSVSCGACLLF